MTTIFVNKIKNNQGGNPVQINQLRGIDTAGSITVQGENTNTTNMQQGLTKEWNLFDQAGNVHGANTIGDSFNVASCSDVSTGHYDVNFTNNMNGTAYNISRIRIITRSVRPPMKPEAAP